jgi:anti-sigma-K factor RskA
MKKNNIDQLFKNFKGSFDVETTPIGHQHRFLDKLNQQTRQDRKPIYIRRNILAIAAVLTVVFAISGLFTNSQTDAADLASVSPEMEATQSFFITTINNELKTLKTFNSPASKILVEDALLQLETLEKQYDLLKIALVESGNDKRVIYAMISNFQKRISLLEEVINKIEEVKKLNIQNNETNII